MQADSTTFEAEAETFLAKAQELMSRYSVTEAMLAARHPGARRDSRCSGRVTTRPFNCNRHPIYRRRFGRSRCDCVVGKRLLKSIFRCRQR